MIIGDVLSFGGSGVLPKINVSGLLSTDSVVATMGSKTKTAKRKQGVNPAWKNLPSGYKQLEYIEANEKEAINTGLAVNSSHKIRVQFMPTSTACTMFGFRNNLHPWMSVFYDVNASGWYWRYGSIANTINGIIQINQKHDIIVELGKITINSNEITTSSTAFSNSITMALFQNNLNGTIGTDDANGRLYYYSVEDSNGVIQELIPSQRLSDSAFGVYDTVSNTFITNSGTGTFTGGSEVPQYIGYYQIDIDSFGLWNVTATSGVKTKTISVNVDTVREYDVEIDMTKTYLYDSGDECESITGGWIDYAYTSSGWNKKAPSITKNANNIYGELKSDYGNGYYQGSLMANNPIDLSKYEKLKIHIISAYAMFYYTNATASQIGITTTKTSDYTLVSNAVILNGVSDVETSLIDTTIELDVSSITTSHYVTLLFTVCDNRNDRSVPRYSNLTFDKIWLE